MSKFADAQRRYMDALELYNTVLGVDATREAAEFVPLFVNLRREIEVAKIRMDEAERKEGVSPTPPAPPE